MTPDDLPRELYPVRHVRRISYTAPHSTPGTKGGQGRSGAELEELAMPLVISVLAAGGIVVAAILRAVA